MQNNKSRQMEKDNESPIKLFCADRTPLQVGNFIFDKTYKNVNEKRKFEKDPKYAYFNTLLKLKSNFRQSNKDVYGFLFNVKNDDGEENNQETHEQSETSSRRPIFTRELAPRQTFHVQKINNHAFKIYKDKRVSRSTTYSAVTSAQSISDINFQVHYKAARKKDKDEKPKIQILLNQYRKLQLLKSRGNPEQQKQLFDKSRLTRMTRNKNKSERGETMPHRKNSSFMTNSRFLAATKRGKGISNMSQLALKISN